MKILLTGGAGYIGSHTYIALFEAGYRPVVLDNFLNSRPEVLGRLRSLTGAEVLLECGDVGDRAFVRGVLDRHGAAAVVHFAALKAVAESVSKPLAYYRNNLAGLISLLEAMDEVGCRTLVYSSSATVYGDAARVPIGEDFPRSHTNPYGHTKLAGEDMLAAMQVADPRWQMAVLRYFNPVGAHHGGMIGEDPLGVPMNLMPYVSQVAIGRRPYLQVFGNDYPTPDGTGVRDYIHVMDLAEGHVAALRHLVTGGLSVTLNLGAGRGYSVLEVVAAFERTSGRAVPYRVVPRRPGDVAVCYADSSRARMILGWQAQRDLDRMCEDAWRWQSRNPEGFASRQVDWSEE